MEIAACLEACGHFVAQLDAHLAGAAAFVCIVALATAARRRKSIAE
jgi:hypothetical protein